MIWGQVNSLTSLHIISLLGNNKMLPVSHKLTQTTQFFQDHDHSPHLWWSGCNWWLGLTGRSSEVTWGHNPFPPIIRDKMKIATRECCRKNWLVEFLRKIYILTYLGRDLTWPDLRSYFEIDVSRSKSMCQTVSIKRAQWCHFYVHISHIQQVINEKLPPWKR